jgi:hypothetical protein
MPNYWDQAIDAIDARRKRVIRQVPESGEIADADWNTLSRLDWLVDFARECRRIELLALIEKRDQLRAKLKETADNS